VTVTVLTVPTFLFTKAALPPATSTSSDFKTPVKDRLMTSAATLPSYTLLWTTTLAVKGAGLMSAVVLAVELTV